VTSRVSKRVESSAAAKLVVNNLVNNTTNLIQRVAVVLLFDFISL